MGKCSWKTGNDSTNMERNESFNTAKDTFTGHNAKNTNPMTTQNNAGQGIEWQYVWRLYSENGSERVRECQILTCSNPGLRAGVTHRHMKRLKQAWASNGI